MIYTRRKMMVEFYLLEELVAFAQCGTLAKAAEQLGLTQPALTHSMKNLEEILGVQLFIRRPNRLSLTETGKYAAREAQKLIVANQKFTDKVQFFEQNQAIITIGANAPGPLIVVRSLQESNVTIKDEHIMDNYSHVLLEEQVTCLIINEPLETDQITSIYIGTENMSINLSNDSPLLKITKLSFNDLKNRTILSPKEIGFWRKIYQENIANGKFIFQGESSEYSELLNYSSIPFFTTNLTKLDPHWGGNLPTNRVIKPLTDKAAHQPFYICFLKRNKNRLLPLIDKVQSQWAEVD